MIIYMTTDPGPFLIFQPTFFLNLSAKLNACQVASAKVSSFHYLVLLKWNNHCLNIELHYHMQINFSIQHT